MSNRLRCIFATAIILHWLLLAGWSPAVAHDTPASPGSSGGRTPAAVEADVCVYGGTSAGVVAAIQAARMGKSVMLLEPGRHLGGMTAGGLSAVDIGDPRSVGGIAREYFTRLVAVYGKKLAWDRPFDSKGGGPATGGAFAIEPHRAERLFNEMVREAKVAVYLQSPMATLTRQGRRLTAIRTEDSRLFSARVFLEIGRAHV